MEDLLKLARKVLKTEADAITTLVVRIDSSFEEGIDILFACSGRVVVNGMGKAGLVGKKIAATLASTGTPAFFMHSAEAAHGDLGMITSEDVILAISNSGETEEIVNITPFLERFNVTLISMTGNARSTLAMKSDVALDISVREEACPLGVVPTASTAAALAMGDAIAVVLLIKRGFREEDFAFFHPGGSLGKKLFIKVKDLMHTGEALPVVSLDTPMRDAIVEISSKRLGITIVMDDHDESFGIITDGDLRRGIEKWGKDFFDLRARDVMIQSPKVVSEDELAVKALSMMEDHSITSLPVPDRRGAPKGIIHLHDILKKGIV